MTTQINYAKVLHATRHATGGADPITPASIGAVPASRTVAGKALSSNVTVAPADLTGATTTGIAVMTATDAPTALTALGAAPTASPTFTGPVIVPTAAVGTNSTVAASTAFVTTAVAAGGGGTVVPTVWQNTDPANGDYPVGTTIVNLTTGQIWKQV